MKTPSISSLHLLPALCLYVGGWLLLLAVTAVLGRGQVTTSGDYYSPPYEFIGWNSSGFLGIANGATWSNQMGLIGYATGSDGTVFVDGPGSKWTNNEGLVVGREGKGTLIIQRGATVDTNLYSYIGNGITGQGVVVVNGTGSTWTSKSLTLAATGTGLLAVVSGGAVFTDDIRAGTDVASIGTISVNGPGSTLTNGGSLDLGSHGGTGSLMISNGASVVSGGGTDVGYGAGSSGTLRVDGVGSSFTSGNNSDSLYLGYDGGTGSLAITNGGTVVSLGSGGVSNGTVTVEGPGSAWTAAGTGQTGQGDPIPAIISVGEDGGTSTFAISNGGSVTSGIMGIGLFGGNATATVDGVGSTLTTTESFSMTKDGTTDNLSFVIGLAGTGSLTLSNGGTANILDGAGIVDLGINNISFGQTTGSGTGAGTLNIGGTVSGPAASGGILNAASVTTGAGTGLVQFNTTADAITPYYFTTTGTDSGNGINITGGTQVINTAGFNVLTGANNYTGGTSITGGTLAIGAGGSLQSDTQMANSSAFVVAAGGSVSGSGAYTQTAGATRIDGSFTQGSADILAGSFTNTGSVTVMGNLTNSGNLAIDGASAVVNVAGTFTQSAAGSSTILHGGSLQSSGINVNDGVFGGMGTVSGDVIVTGGIVQVGASPDTLEIRGNYRQTGGTIIFEIDPDGTGGFLNSLLLFDPNSLVSITNTAFTFNFLNGADPTDYFDRGLFNLNTFFQLRDGTAFGSVYDYSSLLSGDTFSLNQFGYDISGFDVSTGEIQLIKTDSAVPEIPETLGLVLLGFGAVAIGVICSRRNGNYRVGREYQSGTN